MPHRNEKVFTSGFPNRDDTLSEYFFWPLSEYFVYSATLKPRTAFLKHCSRSCQGFHLSWHKDTHLAQIASSSSSTKKIQNFPMSVLVHPVTPFCRWQEILRPPIARRSFIKPIYKDIYKEIQIKHKHK